MKYWLFFSAKIALATALFTGIWLGMVALLPDPAMNRYIKLDRFGQDLTWTTAIFVYFLAVAGTLYVIVLDQRYRCRSCLRRLRMPVNSFLGAPAATICAMASCTFLSSALSLV